MLVVRGLRIAVQRRWLPAVRLLWRRSMAVVALLLLLLDELLVLVWEVLRVSVYELWVRNVVRERYEAIAAFVLPVLVAATGRPTISTAGSAAVMAVRLIRLVTWLVGLDRLMVWREVRRRWWPIGHGGNCDWMAAMV